MVSKREGFTSWAGRHAAWIAAAVYAGLLALFFGREASQPMGSILGWEFGDMPASYYHWREYGFSWLARGVIPFWNPHTYCGHPYAANPETALFYPPNWIFVLVPTWQAMNASILLHLFFSGFFAFLLARSRRMTAVSAMMVGGVYMLSGPILGRVHAGHISILCSIAWFPLLLLCVDKLIEEASWRRIGLSGFVYGMSVLAGHPQVLFYSSFLLGVYTVLRLVMDSRDGWADRTRALGRVVAMGVLGAGIGSVQLLLTWFMQEQGSRRDLTLDVARSFNVPAGAFAGFLMPGYFGDGVSSPAWNPWYAWEVAVFVSVPALMLAVLGMMAAMGKGGRRRSGRIDGLLLVLCMLIASGGIVYTLLFRTVPGFGFFRGPGKIMGQGILFVALLAGSGLDLLMRSGRGDAGAWRICLPVSGFAGLALFALLLGPALGAGPERMIEWMGKASPAAAALEYDPDVYTNPVILESIRARIRREFAWSACLFFGGLACFVVVIVAPRVRGVVVGLVLLVVVGDLYRGNERFVSSFHIVNARMPQLLEGQDAIDTRIDISGAEYSQNACMTQGMRCASGYEPVYPHVLGELRNALAGLPRDYYAGDLGAWGGNVARTEYLAVGPTLIPRNSVLQWDSRVHRARLYKCWLLVTNDTEAFGAVANPGMGFRPVLDTGSVMTGETPPLSMDPRKVFEETGRWPWEGTPLTITEPSPNELLIDLGRHEGGLVYLADTWHRGWRAYVDGEERSVYRTSVAFRGVFVKAGEKELRFVYTAPGFRGGLAASLVAAGVCLALIVIPRRGGGLSGDQRDRPATRKRQ